jgi:O-antigen ligase
MTFTGTFARRRWQPPSAAQAMATAGGALAAIAAGAGVAVDPRLGLTIALAALAIPVALVDLPLAAAVWAGLGLVSSLPAFGLATTAAGALTAGAWLARAPAERARIAHALRLHRRLVGLAALLVGWRAVSLLWAPDPGQAGAELARWCIAGGTLVVLLTSVQTLRDVRLLIAAIVAGTLLSVVIGLAAGGLGASAAPVETATSTEGRLQGATGDPNVLAGYIVPALVLVAALAAFVPAVARMALAGSAVVLVVGLGATQSRGGIVAAGAALAAAFVLLRGRRARVALTALAVACVAAAYLSAVPDTLHRIASAAEDRGNGREDLWLVAQRMSADHPLIGVGLDGFTALSHQYVREPGTLRFVDLVAERPHEVHNTYLQLLAETGVVGLGLFASVVVAALASARSAARRFEAAGASTPARLARAVIVANVGLLTAAAFLSVGSRPTVWVLLALGPLLLGVASKEEAAGWPGVHHPRLNRP